jgi:hypothetical protein
MRPVHDGADPAGAVRERAEGRIRSGLSWTVSAVFLAVLLLLVPRGWGGRWWGVAGVLCVVGLLLDRLVLPRAARRLTAWRLVRRDQGTGP